MATLLTIQCLRTAFALRSCRPGLASTHRMTRRKALLSLMAQIKATGPVDFASAAAIKGAEAMTMTYPEFASGLQKNADSKAWLAFAPDEMLALAFMVDLDNDGVVSWTDFYTFAVLAEQVMRRATTNEKQLSKNFLVQRWESELKVCLARCADHDAFDGMVKVGSTIRRAGTGHQPLALVEFTVIKAQGVNNVRQVDLEDLVFTLNDMVDGVSIASSSSSSSSSASPMSSVGMGCEMTASPLSESQSVPASPATPTSPSSPASAGGDGDGDYSLSASTMSSVFNSTVYKAAPMVDTSIFKHGPVRGRGVTSQRAANKYCTRTCKWKSSHQVTDRRNDRFSTELDISIAKKVTPVFFA